MMKLW